MDFEFAKNQESEIRSRLSQELSRELNSCSNILAVWSGGSSANSAADRFSDLDLNILHAE
jgi:hypothetical protein